MIWYFIAACMGGIAHWFLSFAEGAWQTRCARAVPANRFAGVLFPPPDDPDWEHAGTVLRIGPVTLDGSRLFCQRLLVSDSERVVTYGLEVKRAMAIAAPRDFEAGRARELLS